MLIWGGLWPLTGIHLCHACSCHEIVRVKTARQVPSAQMGVVVLQQLGCSAVASRLAQLVALQYRRLQHMHHHPSV
jgi:hypothetical protein